MKLSVIILNYNVEYFLYQCLVSVERATGYVDAEVIVVDNNSSDGSCAMVRKYFPNVRLIVNTENLGFPKGNNIGVAAAKGEYICILNPDTILHEKSLVKFLKFAKGKNKLGILGPKMIDGKGNFLPESKRGVPTPYVAMTKILGLYKIMPLYFNQYYAGDLPPHQEGAVPILVGAFMLMKRDLYLSVGGFDENCFMYSDDIDLSYMIHKKGYINYYLPHWPMIHYKGESTVRDGKYVKRFSDAMNFFYKKHFKTAAFFNIFMSPVAWLFVLGKRFRKNPIQLPPERYVLFTADAELPAKMIKIVGKELTVRRYFKEISPLEMLDWRTQVIIDTTRIRFSEAIKMMQLYEHEQTTFRMYYKAHGGLEFLVGSDSSNSRGEVTIVNPARTKKLLADTSL